MSVEGLVTPRGFAAKLNITNDGLLAAIVVSSSSRPFTSPAAVVDAVLAVGGDEVALLCRERAVR